MAPEEKAVIVPRELAAALDRREGYKLFYITAPTGWGKTAAVRRHFKGRRHTYVSLWEENALEQAEREATGVLILDDCQALAGQSAMQEQAAALLRRLPADGQAVLLSRAPLPDWLLPFRLAGMLAVLTEDVMALGPGETASLAASMGAKLSQEDLLRLHRESHGHPLMIRLLCLQLAEGASFNAEAIQRAYVQLFAYLDRQLFRFWDAKIRRLLLSVSFFDRFTPELARTLTGDGRVEDTLRRIEENSGFLAWNGGSCSIRYPPFQTYLRHKAESDWSAQELAALYANAGVYYQLSGDLPAALDCWDRGGNHAKVSELLVEHSRLHPGHGVYYQLRRYYRSLPEKDVLSSPELMCGMSILCSLTFDVDGSERWYGALKDYAAGLDRRDPGRREVRGLVSYLDIALPHRGSMGIKDILLAAFGQLQAGKIRLPEFSVTSNLPSILRGGKDFSRWVPRDKLLYDTIRVPVERLLGRTGVGLPDVALAESRYEKGEDISGMYLALSSRRLDIQQRGAPEIEFVLTALMTKCQCDQGGLAQAVRDVTAFRERMETEGGKQLLPSIDAMLCRFALLRGGEEAHRWFVEEAPDENDFFIMERYRYLTKVRCLLQRGEYLDALALLGRLADYFERYDRILDRVEALALLAVCRYRMGEEDWREHLTAALALARPYGYVTVFAHEGAALLPLLRKLEGEKEDRYRARLEKAVRTFAARYPNYLSPAPAADLRSLTKKEHEVLRLMGQNKTNEEIRAILHVSENTLKTHIRNLFRKLGAANRMEAVAAGERLHLI